MALSIFTKLAVVNVYCKQIVTVPCPLYNVRYFFCVQGRFFCMKLKFFKYVYILGNISATMVTFTIGQVNSTHRY